jgi:hypothetical protein
VLAAMTKPIGESHGASAANVERSATTEAAPWWRNATTVTTLGAIVAAIVPITTGVQTWIQEERKLALQAQQDHAKLTLQREQDSAKLRLEQQAQEQELRDRYLSNLIGNPRSAAVVLRFVAATSQDASMKAWAKEETDNALKQVNLIEKCFNDAYPRAIAVVAGLAIEPDSKTLRPTFDSLFKQELLPCETRPMEGAMVEFLEELEKCPRCSQLPKLSYRLARIAKTDMNKFNGLVDAE